MVRGQTKAPQTAPARNLQKVRIESVSPLGCVRPCAKSSSSLRQILFQLAPNPLPACAIPPQRPSALLPGEGSQSFRGMSQPDDYSRYTTIIHCIPFCKSLKEEGPDFHPAPSVTRFLRLHPALRRVEQPIGVAVQVAPQAKPLCRMPKQTARFFGQPTRFKANPVPKRNPALSP